MVAGATHAPQKRFPPPNVPPGLVQPLSPRFRAFLERPSLARWLVALGALLCLPSMGTGLQVDDLLHTALLRGLSPYAEHGQGALRLFTFFDGDPARNRAMTAEGLFPWWTGETIRLSFCRPLSALTHWLDHAAWTELPFLMHVHSFLWLALAIALATSLYRRLLEVKWVAGLAALMFAVHDAHALPATWIANRNATIALVFGLLTLVAHRRRSLLAPVALALALAAGESGLSTVALLVGHAWLLEDDRARWRRLVVYLPVLLGWALLYRHFGFGTAGSTFYIDPGREPLRFAAMTLVRFPLLLAGTIMPLPIDVAFLVPRTAYLAFVAGSWAILLLVARWVYPLVRERPTARYFAFVTAATLLPACATIPSGRLLMFATFGAMGLFAEAIAHGAERPARAMIALRVGLAPVLFVVGSFQMPLVGVVVDRFVRSLPSERALATQDLILVTSFDAAGSGYVSLKRDMTGGVRARHTHVMAIGDQEVTVERVDERSLLVRPRNGFLADQFSRLFREAPFAVGARVEWVHATIEVRELTADGRAAAARFTFREPLEHDGYRFMKFAGPALAPFELPRVGETVTIPPGVLF